MKYFPPIIGLFLAIILTQSCRPSQKITKSEPIKIDSSIFQQKPDDFSSLVEMQTSLGTMKIELFFHTPNHRENFLKLAKQEFYNGLLFHRVIKGFMAQAGDPLSRSAAPNARLGGGGTGYEIEQEINSNYFHIKGALCAARLSDDVNPEKKSSGSQFYIVSGTEINPSILDQNERKYNIVYSNEQRQLYQKMGGAPQLDMQYTVFGRVYEGLEIIDLISNQATNNADRPSTDIKILNIKIVKE